MRGAAWGVVALAALWACGGAAFSAGSDAGSDGSGSGSGSGGQGSSSGGSSSSTGSSSGGSGGGSGSGSGGGSGSGSSSGASSSSSGSGSSSGSCKVTPAPLNHRSDDAQCMTTPPRGTCPSSSSSGATLGMCSTDMQCADAGANGRCILNYGGVATCFCTHDSCDGDTGCAKGETCACHGSAYSRAEGNRCVPSNCRVDSDCGACGWCSPSPSTMACGPVTGYYCHTAQDQCVNDSDCADAGGIGACVFDTSAGHWRCNMELLCQ